MSSTNFNNVKESFANWFLVLFVGKLCLGSKIFSPLCEKTCFIIPGMLLESQGMYCGTLSMPCGRHTNSSQNVERKTCCRCGGTCLYIVAVSIKKYITNELLAEL